MTPQELWQAALGELEILLSKANFTTWFRNTSIANYDNEKVVINVPNVFTKEYLAKKYHQVILKALRNITENSNLKEIEYKIETSTQNKPTFFQNNPIKSIEKELNIEINSTNQKITTEIKETKILTNNINDLIEKKINSSGININSEIIINSGLNPKYTFSTFIVGKNNELAHAAALATTKSPGTAYNPLFIYGGVGLGKTHLMHAVGNKILNENPSAKVLYITCEKFTNEYINAVKNNSESYYKAMEEFNNRYRSLDVFLIDDIQFISGKERTEEVFFNIFNELHQNNKQIIISSDRTPKAIPGIEQRLISRFEWGMIADISVPDVETKIAIIEEKIKEKNFSLKSEIIEYLASAVHNNIRELEGILNRVIALSQLQNRELSLEEVKQITSSIVVNSQKNSLTPKNIIKIVAEYFDVQIEDIIGPCRKKNLTEPRQIIMYLMREELKLSYPSIGQELGGRDHTTVIHACEKIITNIRSNDKLRQDINTLKQKLYI